MNDYSSLHNTLGEDLDDMLAEDDAAIDYAAEPEPISDPEAIDRRLSTLARANRILTEFDTTAQHRLTEMEDRITRSRAPLAAKVDWLTASLEMTHRGIIERDPTRTRLTFGAGVLASKANQPEWQYPEPGSPEEAELVEWVKDNLPEAYVQPAQPDPRIGRDALKAAAKPETLRKVDGVTVPVRDDGSVTVDGEVVPHVKVVGRGRSFTPQPAWLNPEEGA